MTEKELKTLKELPKSQYGEMDFTNDIDLKAEAIKGDEQNHIVICPECEGIPAWKILKIQNAWRDWFLNINEEDLEDERI